MAKNTAAAHKVQSRQQGTKLDVESFVRIKKTITIKKGTLVPMGGHKKTIHSDFFEHTIGVGADNTAYLILFPLEGDAATEALFEAVTAAQAFFEQSSDLAAVERRAMKMTSKDYQWTVGERRAYEQAVRRLKKKQR